MFVCTVHIQKAYAEPLSYFGIYIYIVKACVLEIEVEYMGFVMREGNDVHNLIVWDFEIITRHVCSLH